ncbi:MAG: hypothetical protein RJA59_33 [Pseudomonadota bacterium]
MNAHPGRVPDVGGWRALVPDVGVATTGQDEARDRTPRPGPKTRTPPGPGGTDVVDAGTGTD